MSKVRGVCPLCQQRVDVRLYEIGDLLQRIIRPDDSNYVALNHNNQNDQHCEGTNMFVQTIFNIEG